MKVRAILLSAAAITLIAGSGACAEDLQGAASGSVNAEARSDTDGSGAGSSLDGAGAAGTTGAAAAMNDTEAAAGATADFNTLDSDGDGAVSRDELAAGGQANAGLFAQMDLNKDGRLSPNEVNTGSR